MCVYMYNAYTICDRVNQAFVMEIRYGRGTHMNANVVRVLCVGVPLSLNAFRRRHFVHELSGCTILASLFLHTMGFPNDRRV